MPCSLTSSYVFIGVAQSQLEALNLGLKLASTGTALPLIGAAILAYGVGANPPAKEEAIDPEPLIPT